ncbi:hypothetical protein QAD02_011706 [Eretmocerus hayati]|uniref:Uncharacterized protein n=1 Tax=Eretmocerus hayati TaxID=131215 RepID=A0ACC2NXI5_9HYME|nr:hypothetical protein QAD02_011706 [Eretmocerus hayati]
MATKTLTGLQGECALNNSLYFKIWDNEIFDIMHDQLCGVCPIIIKLVLHEYVIVQRRFSTRHLNEAIKAFDYGYPESKNKPSSNFTGPMLSKKEHCISQKAMQTWLLIRALPFILAEKVNADDEHMSLILHLLRILEIIYAPRIPMSLLPYLDAIIDDFFDIFDILIEEINRINRMHHMSHYSRSIRKSGSLSKYDCMRFEAKHVEVRLRAQNVHNFINPPETVVRVCQSLQCSM